MRQKKRGHEKDGIREVSSDNLSFSYDLVIAIQLKYIYPMNCVVKHATVKRATHFNQNKGEI